MRTKNFFIAGILFLITFMSACGPNLNRYNLQSGTPRIILVDDMLNNIEMFQEIEKTKMPPVEFWDKEGNRKNGKLVQITRNSIVYSIGNYYKFENDSLHIKEEIKTIPKSQIAIFKIW